MRTFGGRGREGAHEATFDIEVSEIIYWNHFRESTFWETYTATLETDKKLREKLPDRHERTRELVKEFFAQDEVNL